jgi:hypothetical protein
MEQRFLNLLPSDIINKIISYTYKTQSKELLNDIKSYYYTKKYAYNIYNARWNWSLYFDKDDGKQTLVHDIIRFMNNDLSILYGYTDQFIEIMTRDFIVKDCEKSIIRIEMICKKHLNTQINILWGLLKHDERSKIIHFSMKTLEDELYEVN